MVGFQSFCSCSALFFDLLKELHHTGNWGSGHGAHHIRLTDFFVNQGSEVHKVSLTRIHKPD